APAIGEQWPDRAVDQARDQSLALGGPAFALEVSAGNAAGRIELLEVVASQRQKVDAFLRLLGSDHGREQLAFAVGSNDGARGLQRNLAGLLDEAAPSPVEFNSVNIKHLDGLSWFRGSGESHEQDGKTLPRAKPRFASASSDPAMAFGPSNCDGRHSRRRGNRQRPRCRMVQRMNLRHPPTTTRGPNRAQRHLATDPQSLDQRLVTRLVGTGEIVEQLATLRYELEQSTSGVVVLDVAAAVLGEIVNAFRKDRHLHFRRSRIAGLGRIGLDD